MGICKCTDVQDERILLYSGDGFMQQVVQRHGLAAAGDLPREVGETRRAAAAAPYRVRCASIVVQKRTVYVYVFSLHHVIINDTVTRTTSNRTIFILSKVFLPFS